MIHAEAKWKRLVSNPAKESTIRGAGVDGFIQRYPVEAKAGQ